MKSSILALAVMAILSTSVNAATPSAYDSQQDSAISAARMLADHANSQGANHEGRIQQLEGNTTAQLKAVNNYVSQVNTNLSGVNSVQTQQITDNTTAIVRQQTQLQQVSGGVASNYKAIQTIQTQLNSLPTPTNGVDGKDGINGKDGVNGKDGKDGATGAQGLQGVQGVAGKQGIAGVNGRDGVDGVNGKDGKNGKDGVDGKQGVKGDKGDTGATGAAGKNGVDGKPGLNGKDGKNGLDGKAGITTVRNYNTTTVKHEVDQATRKAVASLQQAQAKQANTFSSMKDNIDKNDKRAMAGVSSAIAQANLPQVQANQKFMFSAGAGTYEGESSVAVGASVNFNEHVVGKVSFSADTQDNYGAGAGIGIGF